LTGENPRTYQIKKGANRKRSGRLRGDLVHGGKKTTVVERKRGGTFSGA